MGQHLSKVEARLEEVKVLREQAYELTDKLGQAAGTVAAPGSDRDVALYSAALITWLDYGREQRALEDCIRARREGRSLPIPSPTPSLGHAGFSSDGFGARHPRERRQRAAGPARRRQQQ